MVASSENSSRVHVVVPTPGDDVEGVLVNKRVCDCVVYGETIDFQDADNGVVTLMITCVRDELSDRTGISFDGGRVPKVGDILNNVCPRLIEPNHASPRFTWKFVLP